MLNTPENVLFFDTETTGLWPWPLRSRRRQSCAYDRPFAFSFCNLNEETFYFRGAVNPHTREIAWDDCKHEVQWLQHVISDPKMTVVTHNNDFDRRMVSSMEKDQGFSRRWGWQPRGIHWNCELWDTVVSAHVCRPDEMTFGLKRLAKAYCNIEDGDEKELHRAVVSARRVAKRNGWKYALTETHGKKPVNADYWLPECAPSCEEYAVIDAERCMGLFLLHQSVLDENEEQGGKLWDIFRMEQRLANVTYGMTNNGMSLVEPTRKALVNYYTRHMNTFRACMDGLGYEEFDPNKPHSIKRVFIEELGYKAIETTDTGYKKSKKGDLTMAQAIKQYPKCDGDALLNWARGSGSKENLLEDDAPDGEPLARLTLEWKACDKAMSYMKSYDFFSVERENGSVCIHPGWRQAGPVTGRYACGDPNVMQIADAESSRRHARMRPRQREAFGPQADHYWYTCDYSQFEPWIFIFDAQLEEAMDRMMHGWDGHLTIAHGTWGHRDDFLPLQKWWRHRAKLVLFTKLYGGGPGRIMQALRVERPEALEIMDAIDRAMPGIPSYQRRMMNEIRMNGYLVNMFGREYSLPRGLAYKAVNYRIQGSQADFLKRAMIRVDDYAINHRPYLKMFLTLHDELGFEFPKKYHSLTMMGEIAEVMQEDSHILPGNKVPIPVKIKVHPRTWAQGVTTKFERPLKKAA